MNRNKDHIHILVIAPYEAMKRSIEQAVEAYPQIILDVFVGDLDEGANLVSQHEDRGYDCVISRGGTAERIREITELPVIDIEISLYDVLRSFQLAENYDKRYAVVGFPSITKSAHTLCDLLHYEIEIITIHSRAEVRQALQLLQESGCKAVVSDMVVHTVARGMEMDAFLITSGAESLHIAFEQAITLGSTMRGLRLENLFLSAVLQNEEHDLIVFDGQAEVCHSTFLTVKSELLKLLRDKLRQVTEKSSVRFYYNEADDLFLITGRALRFSRDRYVLFQIKEAQISLKASRNGLRFYERSVCERLFTSSFYNISGAMGELESQLSALAAARQPILIVGERGTGKEQIARTLYLRAQQSERPLVTVNCEQIDERTWSWLLSNSNSPLAGQGATIYFQYLEELSVERVHELSTLIRETALERRVRLLFSGVCEDEGCISEGGRILSQTINCLTVHLPTLRQRSDEIPSLASLHLGVLNLELGKQIAGFEPGAGTLLQNFHWPYNYTQFRQVLYELAGLTNSAYIRVNTVAGVLAKQRALYRDTVSTASESAAPDPQTLEEIIQQAMRQALVQHGGNQSAAARQLGIGRSTLWRNLNKAEDAT